MRNNAYKTAPRSRRSPDQPTEAARLLTALANPLRLRILRLLLKDSSCVTDFVEALGTDQPKVSQHLAVLRQAGLIRCRAEGRKRCYSVVNPATLREVLGGVEALVQATGAQSADSGCDEP
ncbi:MAG: ArsR/SmtB family transcription factor [Anaerolineae bacterium]